MATFKEMFRESVTENTPPENYVFDLSGIITSHENMPEYSWYSSPDNEAYKTLPNHRFKYDNDKLAYSGYISIAALFFTNIQNNQRQTHRNWYIDGYVEGLRNYEDERNKFFNYLIDPTTEDKIRTIFNLYSEWRNKYRNRVGFSAALLKEMGYYSGLMFAAAEQLQALDKQQNLSAIISPKYTSTTQQVEAIPTQQPAHFDAKMTYQQAQSLLSALQQNGYIDTSTTADTFYYRMTGNGRPVTDKIVWIKQVSSNGAINKLAVIDFVVCCGVDITIGNARTLIPDIFENNNIPLTINSKTINTAIARYKRQDISEYHNDLLRCIGNIM